MVLEYSPDGHLLYVRLRDGEVAETAEIEPDVYVDLDGDGAPVGVEFVNADDFFPFLRRLVPEPQGAMMEVPRSLQALLAVRLEKAEVSERAPPAM